MRDAGAGFELVLHDERNDENLDELLFELFNDENLYNLLLELRNDEFKEITHNLFDKLRSAANDIRNGCLSKTVRDVQGKTPNPRQQLGFAGLGADKKSTQWVRVG